MTSDRKLKVQRGLEMKDLRDLKDLTIHDVKPISVAGEKAGCRPRPYKLRNHIVEPSHMENDPIDA